MRICKDCEFWREHAPVQAVPSVGSCFRYPPTLRGAGLEAAHPKTTSNDWCGEFQESLKVKKYAAARDKETL